MYENVHPNLALVLLFVHTEVECGKGLLFNGHCALLENTLLIKFIQNHFRDWSGVISASSLVNISVVSLTTSLSLLYLNLLVYHRNTFVSPRTTIFGNLWKFLENVWQCSFGLRTSFGKSLEIFGKWLKSLENDQNTIISMSIL